MHFGRRRNSLAAHSYLHMIFTQFQMGLGKTLMSIALIYTCLLCSIELDARSQRKPIARRVIVVCPTRCDLASFLQECTYAVGSLVDNWKKEIAKWLGANNPRYAQATSYRLT